MRNLFLHIRYLLRFNDCVILPGFGAFIVTRFPAGFDLGKDIITPPVRNLSFNPSITFDDGLLATSFARKYKLSFKEAQEVISKEVSRFVKALKVHKSASIPEFGTFSLNENDNCCFTPLFDGEAINQILGLEPASISHSVPQEAETSLSLESIEDKNLDSYVRDPRYYYFKLHKGFVKSVAAAVAVIVMSWSIYLFSFSPVDNHSNMTASFNSETPLIENVESPFSENNQLAVETEEPETTVATNEKDHFLIVATFKSKKEAEEFLRIHNSETQPLFIVSSLKMTRVAAASSNDKEELQAMLKNPVIKSDFPNAWIWTDTNRNYTLY